MAVLLHHQAAILPQVARKQAKPSLAKAWKKWWETNRSVKSHKHLRVKVQTYALRKCMIGWSMIINKRKWKDRPLQSKIKNHKLKVKNLVSCITTSKTLMAINPKPQNRPRPFHLMSWTLQSKLKVLQWRRQITLAANYRKETAKTHSLQSLLTRPWQTTKISMCSAAQISIKLKIKVFINLFLRIMHIRLKWTMLWI